MERKELYLIVAVLVTFVVIAGVFFSAGGITSGTIIKSVSCFEDNDCNDHKEETVDFCKNPSTEYSLCVNKPK